MLFAVNIGEQFRIKPGVGVTKLGTLGDVISAILPNIFTIAGIFLFLLLLIGGFLFIHGAGQDNPEGASRGKQAITAALIGFLIIFASYWIMQILGVLTGLQLLGGEVL